MEGWALPKTHPRCITVCLLGFKVIHTYYCSTLNNSQREKKLKDKEKKKSCLKVLKTSKLYVCWVFPHLLLSVAVTASAAVFLSVLAVLSNKSCLIAEYSLQIYSLVVFSQHFVFFFLISPGYGKPLSFPSKWVAEVGYCVHYDS